MDTNQLDYSKSELETLGNKMKSFSPVTHREAALAISNDEESFLKFIADNDPAQAYRLLHESPAPLVVGETASFVPDKARVEGEFKLLLVKKDWNTLNHVISRFVVNTNAKNYTGNMQLIKSLQDLKVILPTEKGLMFNVQLS